MTSSNIEHPSPIVGLVAKEVAQILTDEGSGHDWQHISRVRATAEKLAIAESADIDVVVLSALLHDVDDRKVTGDNTTEKLLPNARRILSEAGADIGLSTLVCDTIRMTGFHKSLIEGPDRTLEAQILSDADQLDAIGAVGIARTFVYGASRNRPMFTPDAMPMTDFTAEEYDRNQGSTVAHFFEKLLKLRDMMATTAGRDEARIRHMRMVDFLDAFFSETSAPLEWTKMLDVHRL